MTRLTSQRLHEVLYYSPAKGKFYWLERISIRITVGSVAGCPTANGYIYIGLFGRTVLAHRLAWFYMTGGWPPNDIDHINGDRADNRWENIRAVTRSVNLQNRKRARSGTKTGVLGVTPHQGRYRASIRVYGHQKHIGCFDTAGKAHQEYLKVKRIVHPGNTL